MNLGASTPRFKNNQVTIEADGSEYEAETEPAGAEGLIVREPSDFT